MAKKLKDSGSYNIPQGFNNAGDTIDYTYEYNIFTSLADAESTIGEDKAIEYLNYAEKIKSNNSARVKAKSANGHSTARTLSPEAKARLKESRKQKNRIVQLAKSKGLTPEQLLSEIEKM